MSAESESDIVEKEFSVFGWRRETGDNVFGQFSMVCGTINTIHSTKEKHKQNTRLFHFLMLYDQLCTSKARMIRREEGIHR